jgi:hypothetical protein
MLAARTVYPQDAEFERFLHASVGEDRNGYDVTVLSTLARLNLDPWEEAAELAALGRDAAASRLGLLLSRFRDVPALEHDHGPVARELAGLLPRTAARAANAGGAATMRIPVSSGMIWAVLAVLVILMQMMFAGAPGSGE